MYLGFTSALPARDQSIIWSLNAQWDVSKKKTCLMLAHHRKAKKKKIFKLITFFWM
jgi:hypothetical protein